MHYKTKAMNISKCEKDGLYWIKYFEKNRPPQVYEHQQNNNGNSLIPNFKNSIYTHLSHARAQKVNSLMRMKSSFPTGK